MERFVYDAASEQATSLLGKALAAALPDGAVVALCGTLGAGKTRLVQALAEATGVERASVVSPTFVLVQQYEGRRPIYHIDAYRLRDCDEFDELGPDEFFASPGLTLIEWADRVEESLPAERVEISIEVTGPESRRFCVECQGSAYEAVVDRLRSQLSA